MSLQRACALCPVDRFTFKWFHTYVFVELHTLITDEPTALEDNTFWQTVNRPRDREVSVLVQHSWSDVAFLSCIIRSIIDHLSTLNDYYKCLSWNMYIPTWSCTLPYFLFYLEWYHQLTSQTFTNFQSFNDRISIHVKYFQKVMKIFLIFQCTAFFMLWTEASYHLEMHRQCRNFLLVIRLFFNFLDLWILQRYVCTQDNKDMSYWRIWRSLYQVDGKYFVLLCKCMNI